MSGFGYLNRCLFENGYKPIFGDVIRFIQPQSGYVYDFKMPSPSRYVTFQGDYPFELWWDADCKFIASTDEWETVQTSGYVQAEYKEGSYYIYLVGQDPIISTENSYLHIEPTTIPAPDLHISVSGDLTALGGNTDSLWHYDNYSAPYLFYECTSVTDISELTISSCIYCESMFSGCTNLTNTPVIQYNQELTYYQFRGMFYGCSSLQDASNLSFPDVQLWAGCYSYMFQNSGLIIPPTLQSTQLSINCYEGMFFDCSNLKVSSTETGSYTQPFRIPSEGTASTSVSIGSNIFANTGGTFTGNPVLNETYYLDISAYTPPLT